MKQALHIKNLTKKYKDFTLDHISLDLPYGMILGLIGENGSGKLSARKETWSYRLYLYRHAFRRNIRSRFLFKGNGISYGR